MNRYESRIVILFGVACMAVFFTLVALMVAQTQPKIGPWIGLRIPIFDNLKKGQPQPYWYFKLDPNQFQVTPDPAGTSDGILSLKDGFTAGGVRYQMPIKPPLPDQSFDGGRANEQILSCSVPVQGVSTCVWR